MPNWSTSRPASGDHHGGLPPGCRQARVPVGRRRPGDGWAAQRDPELHVRLGVGDLNSLPRLTQFWINLAYSGVANLRIISLYLC